MNKTYTSACLYVQVVKGRHTENKHELTTRRANATFKLGEHYSVFGGTVFKLSQVFSSSTISSAFLISDNDPNRAEILQSGIRANSQNPSPSSAVKAAEKKTHQSFEVGLTVDPEPSAALTLNCGLHIFRLSFGMLRLCVLLGCMQEHSWYCVIMGSSSGGCTYMASILWKAPKCTLALRTLGDAETWKARGGDRIRANLDVLLYRTRAELRRLYIMV